MPGDVSVPSRGSAATSAAMAKQARQAKFPSPRGDLLQRRKTASANSSGVFPSPRGDLLQLLFWGPRGNHRCFRPLAGICCNAAPICKGWESQSFRPLAGICCNMMRGAHIVPFIRFPSPRGDLLQRQRQILRRRVYFVSVPSRGSAATANSSKFPALPGTKNCSGCAVFVFQYSEFSA